MSNEKFNCKKCNTSISPHNQYLHKGICDKCDFGESPFQKIKISETDLEKFDFNITGKQ
jgi:Zn finger protein HypA/HybF involved in hydrogenase expression